MSIERILIECDGLEVWSSGQCSLSWNNLSRGMKYILDYMINSSYSTLSPRMSPNQDPNPASSCADKPPTLVNLHNSQEELSDLP